MPHKLPHNPDTGAYDREGAGLGQFYLNEAGVPVESMPAMPELPSGLKRRQRLDYHKLEASDGRPVREEK